MQRPNEPRVPTREKTITYEVLQFSFDEFGDRFHMIFISSIFSIGYLFYDEPLGNFIWFPLLFFVYLVYNVVKLFSRRTKYKTITKSEKEYSAELEEYQLKLKDYRRQMELFEKEREALLKQQADEKEKQRLFEIEQKRIAEQKKIAEQKQRELEEKQKQLSEIANWQSKVNKLNGDLKPDWKEFINIIDTNKITKLFHFTDRSNIPSIKANGGLYSWWLAEQKGIIIPKPGGIGFGRSLDVRKGLQNHVRLSFNKRNPMLFVAQNEGRILNPVFLEIDPIVILLNKTLFTKENATKNGIHPNSTLNFFKEIVEGSENDHTSIVRQLLGSSFLINPKAEILVYERIPLEFITNINDI